MMLLRTALVLFLTLTTVRTYGLTDQGSAATESGYRFAEPGTSNDPSLGTGTGADYDPLFDDYDVKFYFIDLQVNDTSTAILGSTSILAEVLDHEPGTLLFDMDNRLQVDSVLLDLKKAEFLHENDKLSVSKHKSLAKGDMICIQVFYHGSAMQRRSFGGLYNQEDLVWGNRVTWSLSEPFSAKEWFPCKQVLEDKADSVYVFITTAKGLKAGSNGILTAMTELPGGKVRYEWKSRYPIAFYLVSFAVSDYRDYSFYVPLSGRDDSLLIQNFIYDNDVFFSNYRDDIDMTGNFIGLFEDLFGPYPFRNEKYGHCIVPSGGGMEHQTMTTLENFSFVMVSHELAHQWFGDLVTCRTWQDIWINEGFASYAEYLAYQFIVSQDKADQWMASAQEMVKMRPDGSIFVPEEMEDDVGRIFDYRLSYKKGAVMIHMIRHEVNNDDLFFDILREFLSRHRNGTASAMDFKDLLEERTSVDFTAFFDQWYYGEGYPEVLFSWQQRNDTLYIRASQSTASPFNLRLDFRITADGNNSQVTQRLASNLATWKIQVTGKVTEFLPDPSHWLLGNFTCIQGRVEDMVDLKGVSGFIGENLYGNTTTNDSGKKRDNLLPGQIVTE